MGEQLRGIITKELDEDNDTDYGEIEFYYNTEDDATERVERVRFTGQDLDEPRVHLLPGDEVEFDLVMNRRTLAKAAIHVVIVKLGGKRDTGVVQSVKDGYGFIKCCDYPTSVYFNFRDVVLLQRDQDSIFVGMEVEFTIETDHRSGKLGATRIRGLPKGTVQFTVRWLSIYIFLLSLSIFPNNSNPFLFSSTLKHIPHPYPYPSLSPFPASFI